SVGVANGIVSLRGAGTLADADVAGLSWDVLGRQVAAGLVSGSLNIETSGDSPAALMAHLQGWAKGRASDGEISGLDLGRALQVAGGGRPASDAAEMAALRRGRTPFSSASVALRLADGVATIEEGRLEGPGADAAMTGSADIGARGLDLTATAVPPPAQAAPANDRLAVAISGGFDAPMLRPLAPPTAPAETPAK
ncbi:MAG: AsmA family protein, partial [Caulobacteraceae bacterium]|nr:AsmA family protein [Caulobacter sp.]